MKRFRFLAVILVAGLFILTNSPVNSQNILNTVQSNNGIIQPQQLSTQQTQKNETFSPIAVIVPGGLDKVASNSRFDLYVNKDNCYVYIADKETGALWQSNPENVKDDTIAEGMTKTDLRSQLIVTYTTSSDMQKISNDYASSVSNEKYTIKNITNGVRIDFTFEDEKFTIPVTYTIDNDGLNAQILFSEVKEFGDNKVDTIDFLQYFGTASLADTGYMFVPDGSGAIINLNNNKTNYSTYEKRVYGDEESIPTLIDTSREENIKIPVFGMVKNNSGFVAVITNGDAQASIKASVSGKTSSYNSVYSMARYRVADDVHLLDQLSGAKDVLYNAVQASAVKSYSVKYMFLDTGESNYVGMANKYRELLIQDGLKKKSDGSAKLFVDLYGGVSKTKSFLGFSYEGTQTLTSFTQAQSILSDLKGSGVNNIVAFYKDYTKDFFNKTINTDVEPANFLGGKTDFEKLMSYAAKNNIELFPTADFSKLYKSGNSFSTFFDVAMGLDLGPAIVTDKGLNTNIKSTTAKPYYLLKPQLFTKAASRIVNTLNNVGADNVLIDNSANVIYSDFSKDGYQRDMAEVAYEKAFGEIAKTKKLAFSSANAYAYPYATYLTDLPLESSENLLFDEDIPFLQMVLKGYVDYSGSPVNITDVSQENFLKYIETGSNIKYAFIEEPGDVLARTDDDFLYGANYASFEVQAKERYKILESIATKVGTSQITSYQTANNIAKVIYSNGTVIYVNYNNTDETLDGITIGAMNYFVS